MPKIRITSLIEGFRRAGMAHSKTPTEHPEGTFSDEQLLVLQAEPNLLVQVIDEPEPEEPTLEQRMKGAVDDLVSWLADADDPTRTEALKIEQAKGKQARKGVLKALGAE